MHSLWNFFLEKRQFSWLLIAALIATGTYAVIIIPKESAPEVIVPIGIVSTVYPGAPAADIEELITNKLEDNIGNVDNISSVTSNSQDGISVITAEFDASADIDKSIADLKDAVDIAKGDLPRDANDPMVSEVNFADQPILMVAVSADLPATEFTRLGELAAEDLESVAGVSRVDVSGIRSREVQVLIKAERLMAYGLSLSQVTQALQSANLTMPVGVVETAGVEYSVRFEGDIESIDTIRDIPVATSNGAPIYIRDVATVVDGVARASTISRASLEGEPSQSAMTLSIYKRAGGDITQITDDTKARLATLQEDGGLLGDAEVSTVFDQGSQVKKDLIELVGTGLETVILVVLCLLLTIGWRESLVAALSIPLSFVIAFIGLWASGNTINFVSLFALILAIGILVDSGIVVTEAIHTRMKKYGNADDAARQAIKEYAWPLIAGTMTTVAVFVPLFFLSGIMGEFVASIPYTLVFVLLASILVALGMVPLIAITITRTTHGNRFEEIQEEYTTKAQAWYRKHLVAFLKNRRAQRIFLWALGLAFFAVLILPISGLMKVVFFPPEDVSSIFIEIETKQGTPVEETDLAVRTAEEILYDKPYIESFTSTAGSGSAFTGGGSGSKFGNITITLHDKEDRDLDSAEISAELREELATLTGAEYRIQEMANGPPTGAPVLIRFFGEDLEELALAVDNAERILNSIEGTRDVTASTKSNATEIVLTLDKAKASALGISPLAVGEILRSAAFGVTATTVTENGDDIDIIAKLEAGEQSADPSAIPKATLEDIRNLQVMSPQGPVLLGSILSERLSSAHASIAHEDEERVETVSAQVEAGTTAVEVVSAFQAREGELTLKDGIRVSYGGETEDINQSFREMFFALIAGLVLMLAILVLCFNSVRYALYLLLAVPYSLIGVFVGLTLTGQPLSFTSLLGVIALAGVIINHAIILMDSLIHFMVSRPEDDILDIVADGSVTRLRPIFLTTVTTVVGMVPLSTISDFWSPLAFAIMFGLMFAMILTLILVPTLVYRHEKKRRDRAQTR